MRNPPDPNSLSMLTTLSLVRRERVAFASRPVVIMLRDRRVGVARVARRCRFTVARRASLSGERREEPSNVSASSAFSSANPDCTPI
jgi:hypothetical protein